jgi:hypothetical protein
MAQLPRVPNLESQRAAIKKLNFLVGEWVGDARLLRGPGEPTELVQTEEAQYKLDGPVRFSRRGQSATCVPAIS